MDLNRLDAVTRTLACAGSRRTLLGALVALPVAGRLRDLLTAEDADAKERRRRKQRHKRRKHPGGRKKGCTPKSKATVCAGQCGPVKSRQTCGKTVDCGSCSCPTPCDPCFLCQAGPNLPGVCGRCGADG